MWNPFKKSGASDGMKMGMLKRLAMKRLQNMHPEERDKVMKEALRPENRAKLLEAMERMKKSGQITDEQIETAKKKIGL